MKGIIRKSLLPVMNCTLECQLAKSCVKHTATAHKYGCVHVCVCGSMCNIVGELRHATLLEHTFFLPSINPSALLQTAGSGVTVNRWVIAHVANSFLKERGAGSARR